MPRRPDPIPKYVRHSSGQARVRLRDAAGNRRDYLLGPYDSPESWAEYERVLALLRIGRTPLADRPAAAGLSVAEVLARYRRYAEGYYANRKVYENVGLALRPVRELYGKLLATEFGPLKLKAVRDEMISRGLSRPVVNQRIGMVKRAFKWAVAEEIIPPAVFHALQTVDGLGRGRTTAREPDPVRPVPDVFVDATLVHLSQTTRAMVELQRLTGMRPGEIVAMRTCDLDSAGAVWLYRPPHHKTAHRGQSRVIAIGPKAQKILLSYFALDTQAYFFSPARAAADRSVMLRSTRKSKVPPSQRKRGLGAQRRRPPGIRYTVTVFRNAIYRACDRADLAERQDAENRLATEQRRNSIKVPVAVQPDERLIPRWHPNQLRHSHATAVRRRFGLEAAQVVLGHARADVTQVYAESNLDLASKVAIEVG